MRRKKKGMIEWLEFELLADMPKIKHGVFLRHGGKSQGAYSSLNTGYGSHDDPANIEANLELIRQTLGAPVLVKAYQSHGMEIKTVHSPLLEEFKGDGFLTTEKNIGLVVGHADCQAAIIYDPIHHAVSNIHCGWRGNVQNIYRQAIEKMQREIGSNPMQLLVCISPSLGPLKSEFINYKTELPESFLPFQFKPTYFNLWEISRAQLLELGILPKHIEIAQICTYANAQDFFSYRREKESGRHATVVVLN